MSAAALPNGACVIDGRGPLIRAAERVLRRLRDEERRAVRIADLDCRSGRRLRCIARLASGLGFVAVEACGHARTPEEAAAATHMGARRTDAAIGFSFDAASRTDALAVEAFEGADLIIAAGGGGRQ